MLALDDLQWADPATWDTLVHLVRWLADAPVVLLLAVREEALHGSSDTARAVAELNRQRALTHLSLRRLHGAEVRQMIRDLLGSEPGPALADLVSRRSEGNPFFVEEVPRGLAEGGALRPCPSGWDLTVDHPAVQALPVTLRLAIRQRVQRLPEETRAALTSAAVLGRRFTGRTLAAVLDQGREQVETALGPARDAGIVVETEEGWSFSHDTIRETVYEDAGPVRRRLHAAARALEAEGGPPDLRRLAALAYHLRLADEPTRAASAALAAAAAATAVHAPAEALAYVRTGRELRERAEAGQPPNERRAAARLAHGEADLAAGAFAEAEEALRAALADAEAIGLCRGGSGRGSARSPAGAGRRSRRLAACTPRWRCWRGTRPPPSWPTCCSSWAAWRA